jgi:hypothetical protein
MQNGDYTLKLEKSPLPPKLFRLRNESDHPALNFDRTTGIIFYFPGYAEGVVQCNQNITVSFSSGLSPCAGGKQSLH